MDVQFDRGDDAGEEDGEIVGEESGDVEGVESDELESSEDGSGDHGGSSNTVSYTHLTLPTICSV